MAFPPSPQIKIVATKIFANGNKIHLMAVVRENKRQENETEKANVCPYIFERNILTIKLNCFSESLLLNYKMLKN